MRCFIAIEYFEYSLLIQTFLIADIFIVSKYFREAQVLYSYLISPKFVHWTIGKHCFKFTIAQRQAIIWTKDEPVHCFIRRHQTMI